MRRLTASAIKKNYEQFSDDRSKDPEPGVPGHVLELCQGVENDNHETCPTFRMELDLYERRP